MDDLEPDGGRFVDPGSTAVIGPEGGTITSADGLLSLEIPAGALAAETSLSVRRLTADEICATQSYLHVFNSCCTSVCSAYGSDITTRSTRYGGAPTDANELQRLIDSVQCPCGAP